MANTEELLFRKCFMVMWKNSERITEIMDDPSFRKELDLLLKDYAGRPTPLYFAERLSKKYGTRIYLKREDLCHTGAHKINNTIGQILLAQKLGKRRIIAETGAGQHGVATATVCALKGLECIVYMGEKDIQRQAPNGARGDGRAGARWSAAPVGVTPGTVRGHRQQVGLRRAPADPRRSGASCAPCASWPTAATAWPGRCSNCCSRTCRWSSSWSIPRSTAPSRTASPTRCSPRTRE